MPKGQHGSKKTYHCQFCGKENDWGWSKTNKFCDNQCQGDWKWVNETIPRLEAGLCSHNAIAVFRRYLIEKFGERCAICSQGSTWNDKGLQLQVDHIDGDSDNNLPSNLRLLCPNCHTQTDTFGTKGRGNRYKKNTQRNQYIREYRGAD